MVFKGFDAEEVDAEELDVEELEVEKYDGEKLGDAKKLADAKRLDDAEKCGDEEVREDEHVLGPISLSNDLSGSGVSSFVENGAICDVERPLVLVLTQTGSSDGAEYD
jgi:hypothetical protein